jgi:hypothetical protein
MLTASFPRRGEQSLLFRRMEGPTENFNPGDNFTPRGQIHPWGGQSLILGAKLRMGLWYHYYVIEPMFKINQVE